MDKALQLTIKTEEKINACAFTGHRELGEEFSPRRLTYAVKKCIEEGACVFYSGMAMGFDLLASETVLRLKKRYPHVRLVACIPCYEQEKHFSQADKKRYVDVLKKADEKVMLSDHYFKGCMQNRDRYMADRADVLIAYCKKETGGAAYTVGYFQKKYPTKRVIFL